MEKYSNFLHCLYKWWCKERKYEYTTSSSQLIPFQNVSIVIPEWNYKQIQFTGGVGVVLFSKPFVNKKIKEDISISNELFTNHIEGWVNIIVYSGLIINLPSATSSGEVLITMPVSVPPLMAPSKTRHIVIFDKQEDYDPFGFQPSTLVPFIHVTVVIDTNGIVSLIIIIEALGQSEITIQSTKQFILEYKL